MSQPLMTEKLLRLLNCALSRLLMELVWQI